MAREVAAALSIALLLLPALGPQIDHHFAERRPDHAHVYLGAPAPDHDHSFEKHDHAHPEDADYSAPAYGVVCLSSADGSGPGPSDAAAPALQRQPVYPGGPGGPFAFRRGEDATALSAAHVAPPRRPPRG